MVPEQEFRRIGVRLREEGLVGANFGNMSIRSGDGFLITRTGSYLDDPGPLVFVRGDCPVPPEVSSESLLHREVYRITPHDAVVHAHPPCSVALSLIRDEVVPVDSEGEMFCPRIPVVGGKPGSREMAGNVASALRHGKAVLVRGHGTFAAGRSLDEAYVLTSLAEHSCRVLWMLGLSD